VVFGADLIAGFPTETDDMFAATMDIVDACDLTYLHVFPFSPRRGTPAARMPQLASAIGKERAARLREKGQASLEHYLARQSGTTAEVLVEGRGIGRTPHFAEVALDGAAREGALSRVRITGHDGRRLAGELVA
jgi:threonylcarbamoyladenosine tRNA methylthiotransferase MtaB